MLEALQACVPAVASRIDGIMEDVTDRVEAPLVQPGNVSELSGALTHLLSDPRQRRGLGQQGRPRFERRFTWCPPTLISAFARLL
jgi:glycosyltransferase involved in cell wall biosynthesis